MDDSGVNLLICTVGGSPEPLVKALCHWQPSRVLFVPSEATVAHVDVVLQSFAERTRNPLSPGAYERFLVPDAENLDDCLRCLRGLDDEVQRWVARGADHRVVADFTAGTKCMTAALALQARRWPCCFSYVGGSRRTKEGVGVVESGSERVVHSANPWDALGYQAVEDFVVLFDQRAFNAAASAAKRAKLRVSDPARKRELAALEQMAGAFDAWDRFDHKASKSSFENVRKSENDLRAALGSKSGTAAVKAAEHAATHIATLCETDAPSRHHVVDLLANARRRADEGRWDDAVARLYRAIEATAQAALKERHEIPETGKVPAGRVPESLRSEWAGKVAGEAFAVSLQDAYVLLAAFQDPLGARFKELELDGQTSPLAARNRSILAHGFDRMSESDFRALWNKALPLADVREGDLPSFPTLGSTWES